MRPSLSLPTFVGISLFTASFALPVSEEEQPFTITGQTLLRHFLSDPAGASAGASVGKDLQTPNRKDLQEVFSSPSNPDAGSNQFRPHRVSSISPGPLRQPDRYQAASGVIDLEAEQTLLHDSGLRGVPRFPAAQASSKKIHLELTSKHKGETRAEARAQARNLERPIETTSVLETKPNTEAKTGASANPRSAGNVC